jgi:hypothetical protein
MKVWETYAGSLATLKIVGTRFTLFNMMIEALTGGQSCDKKCGETMVAVAHGGCARKLMIGNPGLLNQSLQKR